MANKNLTSNTGGSILFWDNENFFNLSCFKAKTRTHVIVCELLYADDAALCALFADQLQELLNRFSRSCDKFSLKISFKKTVTTPQSSEIRHFTVNDTTLENVEKFAYLGSTITNNTMIDQELSMWLGKASTTFGRLAKRVWKTSHLSIGTKVRVYKVCVLSILLYGEESWATYRPEKSKLNAFSLFQSAILIRQDLGGQNNSWRSFQNDCFQGPISLRLKFFFLCWARHVNRMPRHRIPRLLLHGVLEENAWHTGRPCHEARFKASLLNL